MKRYAMYTALLTILVLVVGCSSDDGQQQTEPTNQYGTEQEISRLQNELEQERTMVESLNQRLDFASEKNSELTTELAHMQAQLYEQLPWQNLDDVIFDHGVPAEDCPAPIGVFEIDGAQFVLCGIKPMEEVLMTAAVREGYWAENIPRGNLGDYPTARTLGDPQRWDPLTDLRHPAFLDVALTLRELAELEIGSDVCIAANWDGAATFEGIYATVDGDLEVVINFQGDSDHTFTASELGLTPMKGGGWNNTYVSEGRCP